LAVIRKFFSWAVERSIIEVSPALHVKKPSAEASRDRVLSDAELRLIWLAAEALGYPYGPLVRLLALTGQRRSEIAGMRRDELSGALWTIPAQRTKNGRAHEVPLSTAAQAVLAALPRIAGSDYVLTANGRGPASGFARAKNKLDAAVLTLAQEHAAERRQNEPVRITPWRLHDLRRTMASGLARLGTSPHVIEAILNHRSGVVSGVAAVYNRHQYLDEKRAALEQWARHLKQLADRDGNASE
jgi:integrase